MGKNMEDRVESIVQKILDDYGDTKLINKIDLYYQPDKKAILDVMQKLLKILYPGYYMDKVCCIYSLNNNMASTIEDAVFHLNKQILTVMRYCKMYTDSQEDELEKEANRTTYDFMVSIPKIREYLETDIQAAFEGDPAATRIEEVILSYPGLYAISIYRLAHELEMLGVPMIPRIMTEYAHSVTGIDIHPGAKIGKYFFMDHGTGIVIGETTEIGEHVKIYQGVTLGALSTKGGQQLRNKKRHPTIGNYVTIYSGATILGGDTTIEDKVVVGGNTFITSSIQSGVKVRAVE